MTAALQIFFTLKGAAVLYDFDLYVSYPSGSPCSFFLKIDEIIIPVDISFGEENILKISVDSPIPVSIILTVNIPRKHIFMYEKNVFYPKFMDQVLLTEPLSAGTNTYGSIKICRLPTLNPTLNDLFDNGGIGDFVIVAENQEIKVNKDLLKIHSSVFDSMFKSDCIESKENKVTIEDFSYDVVKTVAKIIYSKCVSQNTDFKTMQDVCRFADKYDLKILWDILKQWFDDHLTYYNVCEISNVSITYNFPIVLEKCVSILVNDLKNVYKMENFRQLNAEVLRLVLEKYGS